MYLILCKCNFLRIFASNKSVSLLIDPILRKCFFLFLALQSLVSLHAQERTITYNLIYEAGQIKGSGSFKMARPKADSIYIHLPSRAYTWGSSFLNEQLKEYQDVDLHFAGKEKKGHLKISQLLINGRSDSICQNCEFAGFGVDKNTIDSIIISFNFELYLPDAGFTGNGIDENCIHIIDLLPRPAAYFNAQWVLHPVSYHFDFLQNRDQFSISLKLPAHLQAISNLKQKLITAKEDGSTIHLVGNSRNLQIHIAPQFYRYTINSKQAVFSLSEDSSLAKNVALLSPQAKGFFKAELNDSLNYYQKIFYLKSKKGEYQSEELLSLETPKDPFNLIIDLVQAQGESFFRYHQGADGFNEPWIARGIPYYYKYQFIRAYYPEKRWIPFSNIVLDKLFALNEFDFAYQNRFLFLYLQRQGLDQAPNSSIQELSRLNYDAVVQAKTYLNLAHLQAYTGAANFKRAMARYCSNSDSLSGVNELKEAFAYFERKEINWFFEQTISSGEIYDYQVRDFEHCPTISSAKIHNTGHLATPYSITGFKEGKAIITQWYEGHEGSKDIQLYHDDFDKIVINAHLSHAEYNQKNNTYYNRWFLPKMEPLSFQFYNSFEAPEATQVFYMPSAYYNAYDKLLLGVQLSNRSLLLQKPFEYSIIPEYSTGTSKLTGSLSLAYNYTLPKSNFFRQLTLGIYSRYYHYDRDLAYSRVSPALNLRIRKSNPRSAYIQSIRFRGIFVDRELPSNFEGTTNQLSSASFSVFNASYRLEKTDILNPLIFRFHTEASDKFGKIFTEVDQRWMLPNKRWLIWRSFGGLFLYNKFADEGLKDNYYSFGLSGSPDYLFDYYLIGRSDRSGIWSRQFFTSDGGFKSETGAFADEFMLSTSVSLPIYSAFGLFGDYAITEEGQYWDYGVRIAFLTDFIELYFPLQNQDRDFYKEENYLSNIRFVLDFDLGNIINRARRAYY